MSGSTEKPQQKIENSGSVPSSGCTSPTRRRGGKVMKLLWRLAAVVVIYLGLTSSFTVTRIILPIVSKYAGIELVAQSAIWRPFKNELTFRDFRVGTADFPWVEGAYLHGKYNPIELISGKISFEKVTLNHGTVRIIIGRAEDRTLEEIISGKLPIWDVRRRISFLQADGLTLNDDPLITSVAPNDLEFIPEDISPEPSEDYTPNWLNRFDFDAVEVADGRLLYFERHPADGRREKRYEVFKINGYVTNLGPDYDSRGEIKGEFLMEDYNGISIEKGSFALSAGAELGNFLIPKSLDLTGSLKVASGTAGDQELSGADSAWEMSLVYPGGAAIEVNKFKFRQYDEGELASSIDVVGFYHDDPLEYHWTFDADKISPELFSLFCVIGWSVNPGVVELHGKGDFGFHDHLIYGKGNLELTRSGAAFVDDRQIDFDNYSLNAESDFTLDLAQKNADIGKANLELRNHERMLMEIRLFEPAKFSWNGAKTEGPVESAKIKVEIRNTDLRLLHLFRFVPTELQILSGFFSASMTGEISDATQGLRLSGRTNLSNVALDYGSGKVEDLELAGDIGNFSFLGRRMKIDRFSLHLLHNKEEWAVLSGDLDWSAYYRIGSGNFRIGNLKPLAMGYLIDPEFREQLTKALYPVRSECRGSGKLNFKWNKNLLFIEQAELELHSQDELMSFVGAARRITLDGENNFYGFRDWIWDLSGSFSGELMQSIQPDFPDYLARCRADVAGALNFGRDYSSLKGEAKVKFTLPDGGGEFDNEISFFSSDYRRWEADKFAGVFTASDGRSGLRFEMPFVWNVDKFEGNCSIRYLNEAFLNLLTPGKFDRAAMTGGFQFTLQNAKRLRMYIGGKLDIDSVHLVNSDNTLSGDLNFMLDGNKDYATVKNLALNLRANNDKVFEGLMRGYLETSPGGVGQINLEIVEADGDFWHAEIKRFITGKSLDEDDEEDEDDENDEVVVQESAPISWAFDFPGLDYTLDAEIKSVRWAQAPGSVKMKINAKGREINFDPIRIQSSGGTIRGALKLTSSPDGAGVSFQSAGKSEGRLPLGAIFQFFAHWPDSSGMVENAEWNFTGGGGTEFGENFNGNMTVELSELVFPNTMAEGPMGALLFLPMEIILRLSGLFPTDFASLNSWERAVNTAGSINAQAAQLHFEHGEINISAENGVLQVTKLELAGQAIKQFRMNGQIELTGEQNISLRSVIALSGPEIPVRIDGTLSDPEVDSLVMLPDIMYHNTRRLLRGIWKFLPF